MSRKWLVCVVRGGTEPDEFSAANAQTALLWLRQNLRRKAEENFKIQLREGELLDSTFEIEIQPSSPSVGLDTK